MLEALIITLREGIEAALVVGLILSALRQTGQDRFRPAVWWGLAAAVAGSLGAAVALRRLPVNEEAYEGVLLIAAAVMVGTMLVWMHRNARTLGTRIREQVGAIAGRPTGRAWLLAGLVFLMVFREGAETVLFLGAVSLTTSGLLTLVGALVGLGLAVAFGVAFFQGALQVNLRRFFTVTEIILAILILQLLIHGYHELAEAGWLPATPESMAVVGPVVRNHVLFLAVLVLFPMILVLTAPTPAAPAGITEGPERRKWLAATRRRRRIRVLNWGVGGIILGLMLWQLAGGGPSLALTPPTILVPQGDRVTLPLSTLPPGELQRFAVEIDGHQVRFLVYRDADVLGTAVDACEMCGAEGYVQQGDQVICRNCTAEIYIPSIGRGGGCNPIPLPVATEGDLLVARLADLRPHAALF